jgi:S1-C subfamily serine protease
MNPRVRLIAVALVVLLLGAACSSGDGASLLDTTTTSVATTTSTTSAPTTTTTAVPPTTTTTVPAPLTPQEVFAAVSPALAFIETDLGTGSGVLFRESLLVTNAHVVWPFDSVRVVFPDGVEITEAAVTHLDEMADLAIVDLAGASGLPAPLSLGDPAGLEIGSELFLVGYPGEVETFPQPTLTRGILSRIRTIEALDLDFLQTDAVIAGGQSGGALVDDDGVVIGISGLGTEGFALATSAADVLARLDQMLAGVDVDGITDREFPGGPGEQSFGVTVDNFFSEIAWVVDLAAGDEIIVDASSDGDAALSLIAIDGIVEAIADEGASGTETLVAQAPFDSPYFVTLGSFAIEPIDVTVSSNFPMRPLLDPDDGMFVAPGDTINGYADYPGDVDFFLIDLAAGDTITVLVSAVLMDPELVIDLADNQFDPLAADSDSGGGLFGTDSLLTFTADTDATFLLVVADAFFGPGGYVMTID